MRYKTIRCVSCRDYIDDVVCTICGARLIDLGRCEDCHRELAHRIIADQNVHFLGGTAPVVDDEDDPDMQREMYEG